MSTLIKLAVVAGIATAVVVSWPDIKRYIKMSQM